MGEIRLLIHMGLICAIVLSPVPAAGTEFYVSPTGDDTQAGSEQAPFRTMARAVGEVRKKVAEGLREPVTVLLRSGHVRTIRNLDVWSAGLGNRTARHQVRSVPWRDRDAERRPTHHKLEGG